MSDFEQKKDMVEGVGNIITLGLAGIVQLAKMATFDECKVYIVNNHFHKVFIAIDDSKRKKVKGWYIVNANTTKKIYKTERATNEVGMHAFCPICCRNWGTGYARYIPVYYGEDFEIEYNDYKFHSFENDPEKRLGYFSSSPDVAKKKECTFTIY